MRKNPFYKVSMSWHWKNLAEIYAYTGLAGMLAYYAISGSVVHAWLGFVIGVIHITVILANIRHYQVLTEGLKRIDLYRIEPREFRVLYRGDKTPPNLWTISHWDGPWVVLQNECWNDTTCAILPKHVIKIR